MSVQENLALARAWLHAFNAHDVDALVALYAEDAHHTSPKLRAVLHGKPALAQWWRDCLVRLPTLRYEERTLTASGERVFLEYTRHVPDEPPMPVAEVFDVKAGRIVASRVYHG
ncbi:MAG: nuclear transport factor 2 family protein [Myxococcaceae bacterium]